MMTPIDLGQSSTSTTLSQDKFFIEISPSDGPHDDLNGPEPLRLIFNQQTGQLQLVGQFYPQKADELWTNVWTLEVVAVDDEEEEDDDGEEEEGEDELEEVEVE